jgi:hypothetical protein
MSSEIYVNTCDEKKRIMPCDGRQGEQENTLNKSAPAPPFLES